MGTDKALAIFAGRPLIANAIQILSAAGLSQSIAGSRSDLSQFAAEIKDTFPETGPLGGIHAALFSSETEWSIFLPVDMPLMPPELLTTLLGRARTTGSPVTAARLNGRLEPFPVVLNQATLSHIEMLLTKHESGCQSAWQAIPRHLGLPLDSPSVESLVQSGQCRHQANFPPSWWFHSANTPAELNWLNEIHRKNSSDRVI
jgi:molybdopterin-guanine dinucleotide biosynthesis protein A